MPDTAKRMGTQKRWVVQTGARISRTR
jgi:hypothetical protein